MRGELERPSRRAPSTRMPRELEAVVLRAMAARPEDRYPDVPSLQADVEVWLEGRLLSAVEYSAPARAAKWIARNRAVSAVAAAGLVSVVALAVVSAWRLETRRREAEDARRAAETLLAERERRTKAQRLFEQGRAALDRAANYQVRPDARHEGLARLAAQARRSIEAGIELAPDLAEGPYLLGRTFDLEGRSDEALQVWRRTVETDPSFDPAWLEIARVLAVRAFRALGRVDDPERAEARALAAVRGSEAHGEHRLRETVVEVLIAHSSGDRRRGLGLARAGVETFADEVGVEDLHWLIAAGGTGSEAADAQTPPRPAAEGPATRPGR